MVPKCATFCEHLEILSNFARPCCISKNIDRRNVQAVVIWFSKRAYSNFVKQKLSFFFLFTLCSNLRYSNPVTFISWNPRYFIDTAGAEINTIYSRQIHVLFREFRFFEGRDEHINQIYCNNCVYLTTVKRVNSWCMITMVQPSCYLHEVLWCKKHKKYGNAWSHCEVAVYVMTLAGQWG